MRVRVLAAVIFLSPLNLKAVGPSSAPDVGIIHEKDPEQGAEVLPDKLKRRRISAIEFRDATGKMKRRVDFKDHFRKGKAGEERYVEVKKSSSGKRTVVQLGSIDRANKNPYDARRQLKNELVWYDDGGSELGRAKIPSTSRVQGMSQDGRITAVVDAGFDPEELAHAKIPDLAHTDVLKNDSELTGHKIRFFDDTAKLIAEQSFAGASAPNGVHFSRSGEWVIYSVGKTNFVRNLNSGHVESFESNPLKWDLQNNGDIIAWGFEGSTGQWVEFEGRKVWKPAQEAVQRKYIRALGESGVTKTEETRKVPL